MSKSKIVGTVLIISGLGLVALGIIFKRVLNLENYQPYLFVFHILGALDIVIGFLFIAAGRSKARVVSEADLKELED